MNINQNKCCATNKKLKKMSFLNNCFHQNTTLSDDKCLIAFTRIQHYLMTNIEQWNKQQRRCYDSQSIGRMCKTNCLWEI